MRSRLRNVPLVLVAVGLLLAFPGPDIVSSEQTGFLLAVGGSILTWGSFAVLAVRKDDLIHDLVTDDEHIRQHTFRSRFVTWVLMLAVMTTLLAFEAYYPEMVEPHNPIMLAQAVAVGVFGISMSAPNAECDHVRESTPSLASLRCPRLRFGSPATSTAPSQRDSPTSQTTTY